jgi:hypothetical protein
LFVVNFFEFVFQGDWTPLVFTSVIISDVWWVLNSPASLCALGEKAGKIWGSNEEPLFRCNFMWGLSCYPCNELPASVCRSDPLWPSPWPRASRDVLPPPI